MSSLGTSSAGAGRKIGAVFDQRNLLPLTLLYSLLLPAGLFLELGDIRLSPFRALLLISLPFIIVEITRRPIVLNLSDSAILMASVWIFAILLYHYGLSNGIQPAGREVADLALAYILMRVYVRSIEQVAWLLRMFAPGLLIIAGIMAFESFTFKLTFFSWFPVENVKESSIYQERLGLLRAWGPFQHPIHGGLFLATFLPLYASLSTRPIIAIAGVIAATAGFFSLSSAAIMALLMGTALIIFWRLNMMATGKPNWWLLVVPSIVGLTAIQLTVGGGAGGFVMRYLSLSPATASYRRLIWDYGSESVMNNPLFGIGYAAYERLDWMVSASIDSHWLALAVRYGLPALILLLAALLYAVHLLAKSQPRSLNQNSILHAGLLISLVTLAITLLTVFAWLHLQVLFSALLGIAVGIGTTSSPIPNPASPRPTKCKIPQIVPRPSM